MNVRRDMFGVPPHLLRGFLVLRARLEQLGLEVLDLGLLLGDLRHGRLVLQLQVRHI